jgi:hypothetical protein
MVRQLVPDGLWELFLHVMPEAPIRPHGGGRRTAEDLGVLAAILFVATSGCTWRWRQLPPQFGASWQPAPTADSHAGPEPAFGPSSTAWSSMNWVPAGNWTGRGVRSTQWARGRQKGAADRTESDRPRQTRIEDSPDYRPERTASLAGHLGRPHARQPRPRAARARDPADPFSPWTPPATARETPRRQGVRLRPPAPLAPQTRHPPPNRSQGHRVLATTRPPPVGSRADRVLACWLPPAPPPLRRRAEHFLGFVGTAATLICHRRLTNETTSYGSQSDAAVAP